MVSDDDPIETDVVEQPANGTILNPPSGLCLTAPGTSWANGLQLTINTCTGAANQKFIQRTTDGSCRFRVVRGTGNSAARRATTSTEPRPDG